MKFIYTILSISVILLSTTPFLFAQNNTQSLTIDAKQIKGNIDRRIFSIVGYDAVREKGDETGLDTYKILNLRGTLVRLGAGINDVEPKNDDNDPFHFNWEGFQLKEMFGAKTDSKELIKEIKEQGMEPVILFCYNSFWLGENGSVTAPPENNDEWSEYVCAVLEYFNGNGSQPDYTPIIKYAEIWNEPSDNGLYWSGDRFQYFKMFNNVAERIHKNYPGVLVGGPTVLNGETVFLKDFLKHCGKNVDFLTYHIYGKSVSEMKLQIESWVNFARESTGKKDLKMMITESDNISISEKGKTSYILERQFALMEMGDILEGFHHFCAVAYGEGGRFFGLVYPDGGIISHNYWPYWIFRNLEGEKIEIPPPSEKNIIIKGSYLKEKEKLNVMIFSREKEKSFPIDLKIQLEPLSANRIVCIEKVNNKQHETYGIFFLASEKEETTVFINLEPQTAYSVVISKPDLYSHPIIESKPEKTSIYMGDEIMFHIKVINPFETPVSGKILFENLPSRWIWMSKGGIEFKNLQQGFTYEARYALQANSPTSMKDGIAVHETVYWKAPGWEKDEIAHAIPNQMFAESPIEFDSLPHLICARPGSNVPFVIGVTNLSNSPLEGTLSLVHGFELPGQTAEITRVFKIDKKSKLESHFNVALPPKPSQDNFDITAKILIGDTEIKKDMKLVIKDYTLQKDVLPLDLRTYFNADPLSFTSNTDDILQSGGPYSFPAEFFPEPGIKEVLGVKFYIPDKSDGIKNAVKVEGQTLTLKPDKYTAIYLLASATNGDKDLKGAAIFDNGSSVTIPIQISDWCSEPKYEETPVIKATHRHSFGGDIHDAEPAVYFQKIPLQSDRDISAIILPKEQDLFIYAVTMQSQNMEEGEEKTGDMEKVKKGETAIFKGDFSKKDLEKEWIQIGSIEPFNKLEAKEGALNLEGGIGDEWFGVALNKEFDWGKSPLTVKIRYTHRANNSWSELGFWFVNKLYTEQNPWNREDFIRFLVYNKEAGGKSNEDFLKVQRDFGSGIGETLTEITKLERDKSCDLEITLTKSRFYISINGELKASGNHKMDFTTGYFYIIDSNSFKGDVDVIETLAILQ